jgi:hypothetical protein
MLKCLLEVSQHMQFLSGRNLSMSRAAGEGHKAAKQRVKEQKLAKVAKVVGVSKLRTKYESAEAKRALCAAYDLFLADERVLPSLPKLLGESATHASQLP